MHILQERPTDLTEVKVEIGVALKRSTLFPLFHGLLITPARSLCVCILLILKDAPAHSPRELVVGFCWFFFGGV